MDLQTVVVKEWGTEDIEIFFKEFTKGICPTRFCHMRDYAMIDSSTGIGKMYMWPANFGL